ncbi:hypothetical protein [Streptosporangium longisporum]
MPVREERPPGRDEAPSPGEASARSRGRHAGSRPRGRTALRAAGAAGAVVLALAASTWNGYSVYRDTHPPDRILTVAAGAEATLMRVSWKVAVRELDDLPGQKPAPGRTWLRIKVTRTSLDAEGVSRRGEPGVEIRHPDGRVWKALPEGDDLPDEVKDHRTGTPYSYDLVGMVPSGVAGQVEVHVRPSTARIVEDESVKDMFARSAKEEIPQDLVLRFTR